MLFALMAHDKPGALDVRNQNRAAHLAYVEETGVVAQAGPILDDAGEMCGSLVILDVEDAAAASAWAEGDPYARAGLFESVTLKPWKRVIG
ncbi:YCII-related domain protein [Pseudooceanicola batsensis HTCC2597]|uniref:YCII-related domain protein n=1 Tax=Pseudooceanicola batsensis (strain ATCC BAA-863 / DSM 15984 / KCTC 12145 / HTCC2597) TaxID=252305 RepID=A3TXX2_PSEBH|nr:YciI family protein [Pseudooceanicola batsensis]EAQ03006.1 YCII-related domain protein [Pseudooceanicola batsensis HTCC2597]